MREIKFRGKCEATSEWVYGLLLTETTLSNSISHVAQYAGVERKFGRTNVKINPESIGQFTGLKDKNGVDIYEGDIVKDDYSRVLEITYWNYRLCFYALSETNFKIADFYDWLPINSMLNKEFPVQKIEVEVIGNIHEK